MNKLVNKFWKVLNEVRGFRDIQDLKELFISLIFLKHANDRHFSNSFIQLSVPKNSKWSFLANNLQNPNFLDFLNEAFFDCSHLFLISYKIILLDDLTHF